MDRFVENSWIRRDREGKRWRKRVTMSTYFYNMKIGPANSCISHSNSHFVWSWRRYLCFPQREASILHVEAEEFHGLTCTIACHTKPPRHLYPIFIYCVTTCLCLYVGAVCRYLIVECLNVFSHICIHMLAWAVGTQPSWKRFRGKGNCLNTQFVMHSSRISAVAWVLLLASIIFNLRSRQCYHPSSLYLSLRFISFHFVRVSCYAINFYCSLHNTIK